MKVLVACEYSGAVRDAFTSLGHDAISCDILPSETPGYHWRGDIFECLKFHHYNFDLMIAHPPCTYLCNSGVRWIYTQLGRREKMIEAAVFFRELFNSPIEKIAVENPIMHKYGKEIIGVNQSQVIHPWQYGHGEQKATCLWLKNLPLLNPTNIVSGREQRIWKMSPGEDRAKLRSKTFSGIAQAMAEQWGN